MIYDYVSNKSKLKELLAAIKVCHDSRKSDSSSRLVCHHHEETTMFDFLEKMGIIVEKAPIPPSSLFTTSYKVIREGRPEGTFDVLVINPFSKGRGRTSVLVQDPKSKLHCILYVKGREAAMKHLINFSSQDKNTFRQLMVKYKTMGLKRIVYAYKRVSFQEARRYLKNYRNISKNTRSQLKNLEALATGVEQDLTFLGCVGMRENLRESSKLIVNQLMDSHVPISILTGDNLENIM